MIWLTFLRGAQRHWHSLGQWNTLSLAAVLLTGGCKAPGEEGLFGVADAGTREPASGAGGSTLSPSPTGPDAGGRSPSAAPVSPTLPTAQSVSDASTEDAATSRRDTGTDADASGLGSSATCPLSTERDAGTAQQTATDAGGPSSCCGQFVAGLCWYLGSAGQSCTQTCSPHGGFDPAGMASIGSQEQGGSLANCSSVLGALLPAQNTPVGAGTRDDDLGLGCHLFQDSETLWWLVDVPFSPTASQVVTRLACSCRQ